MRVAVFAVAWFAVGCAQAMGGEPERYVLEGDTLVVEPARLLVPLVDYPELEAADAGDFVAGVQGGGYVRRITEIDRSDGWLALATEDVALGEAVGEASSVHRVAGGAKEDGTSHDLSLGLRVANRTLYDKNGVQIILEEGTLGFRPTLDLEVDIQRSRIEQFKAYAAGRLDSTIALAFHADAGGHWQGELPVWTERFTATQWIGWVPVVEVFHLRAGVGVDIRASAAADIRVEASLGAELGAGVEYDDGRWSNLANASTQRGGSLPLASADGTVDVAPYLFAEIEVALYGLAGPFVRVMPSLHLRRGSDGTWSRAVGLAAEAGAELTDPFGEDPRYTARVYDREWPL